MFNRSPIWDLINKNLIKYDKKKSGKISKHLDIYNKNIEIVSYLNIRFLDTKI